MRCPSCDTTNPETAKFCGECGAPLAAAILLEEPDDEDDDLDDIEDDDDVDGDDDDDDDVDAAVVLAQNAGLAAGSGPTFRPPPPPRGRPDHLQAFLDAAVPRLAADPRLVGVAAAGSWISGDMDVFSDLDLWIAVAPEHEAEVAADRQTIAASLGPLLAAFTGEHVGEPRLVICLYATEPLAHVDLKFVAAPELARRVEDPVILWERDGAMTRAMAGSSAHFPDVDAQWIEDRFWVWVHYAATKIGRGELFEAIGFFAFVRERVLGPMLLARRGRPPMGVRRLEAIVPAAVPELRATLASHDAASCLAALDACVQLYRALRESAAAPGLVRRSAAEAASVAFAKKIAGG